LVLGRCKIIKIKKLQLQEREKEKKSKREKEKKKQEFPFPVGVFSLAPALAPQQTSRHGQCRGTPTNGGASKT
jgi:hypothetical protein